MTEGIGRYNPESEKPSNFLSDWEKTDRELFQEKDREEAKDKLRELALKGKLEDTTGDYRDIDNMVTELIAEGVNEKDVRKAVKYLEKKALRALDDRYDI